MRLLSAHQHLGPFTVGYPLEVLRAVPAVRELEARTWGLPGWRILAARAEAGRVVLALEKE